MNQSVNHGALEKAQEEFFSVASHKLRSPLTTIGGYASVLLQENLGTLNEKQKEYLQEIINANKRMLTIVNELLNASRIDVDDFSINPDLIDLKKIINEIINNLTLQIKTNKIHLNTIIDSDLPLLKVDEQLMKIVIQNVLINAVTYTSKTDSIKVVVKKDATDVLIQISDTGIGIPAAQQSQIFTKFYRADNAVAKQSESAGLGLYIVKAVLVASGGKIWFDSEENKGSNFSMTLPLTGMKKREGSNRLT